MTPQFAVIQKTSPKEHYGLVNKNHIGYMYGTNPIAARNFSTKLFQLSTNQVDLYDYLDMYPTKVYDREDALYWDVHIDGDKNYVLKECRINGSAITAASRVGIGGSVFEMVFSEPAFYDTDVIFGDHKEYTIRLNGEAVGNSGEYSYNATFIASSDDDFIPYSELVPGKRFSRLYGGAEYTMSSRGTKMNIQSPFRLMNYMTTIRMEDTVPGGIEKEPITLQVQANGKKFNVWETMREYLFDLEFRKHRANALYYARLNMTKDGKPREYGPSGYEYIQGAGLAQQLEGSGFETYPTEYFSIKGLTNMLLDLSTTRLSMDKRKFVLHTGEHGMVQFSEALQDYASLYTPLSDNSRVVAKGGNILQYKGQFLEFMGPAGIEVTLKHDPFKDDPIHNKILHPNGGLASSYQYDIMDIGTVNGEPNIFKVAVKGYEDVRGYESGLGSPWNLNGNEMISNPVHAWKEHRMWKGGVIVADPTRCKIYKPSILV